MSKNKYVHFTQEKNIGWKMSFYLFNAISFYPNIVLKNIVCELGLKEIDKTSLKR